MTASLPPFLDFAVGASRRFLCWSRSCTIASSHRLPIFYSLTSSPYVSSSRRLSRTGSLRYTIFIRNPYKGYINNMESMEITRWHIILGVLIGTFIVISFAYAVPTSYRTYQFTSAAPLNNDAGTWVFHLADGTNLTLSNAYTRDDVLANQTWTEIGGYIQVGYSFIGYPVTASYLP